MKKLLVIIIAFVVIHSSYAQEFRIGVKGAFNSTWLFNNNVSDAGESADYEASWGSHLGLAMNYYFSEDLGISVDLLYATQTQNLSGYSVSQGSAYGLIQTLNYLDIPILFRVSSEGGPYVEIGPQVGLLLSAKEEFDFADASGFVSSDIDAKDDYNSINLAAVLGFGYDIAVGDNFFINIGLRFGYGLTDVTNEYTQAEIDDRPADSGRYVYLSHYDNENDLNYQQTTRAFGGLMLGFIYRPN